MVMGYVPQAFKLYYIAVFKLYFFLQRLEHAMVLKVLCFTGLNDIYLTVSNLFM